MPIKKQEPETRLTKIQFLILDSKPAQNLIIEFDTDILNVTTPVGSGINPMFMRDYLKELKLLKFKI